MQASLRLVCVVLFAMVWAREARADAPVAADRLRFQRYDIKHIPFAAGETFEYTVTWNGIPAADGTAWVERSIQNGKDVYDFQIITKTNPIIDILYKMHDTGKSTVDAKTLLPINHVFLHQENERRRRITSVFDHEAKMVSCMRELLHKDRVEKVRMSFQFAFDAISAPYYLRCLDWKVGDCRQIELVEDNGRYLFTMKAVGAEEITVPAGRFRALRMAPSLLKLSARRNKPTFYKEAEIWVSDDLYHIPLRLKTASFIGHLYVDLTKFKLGAGKIPPSLCQ